MRTYDLIVRQNELRIWSTVMLLKKILIRCWLHPDWILAYYQPFAKRGLYHFNLLNAWKVVFEAPLGDKNVKTNRGLRKTCIVQATGWHLTWRSLAGWCLILRMSCSLLGCTPKCSKVFDHCFPSWKVFGCIFVSFMACCMRNHNCEECELAIESNGAWWRILLPLWGTYFVSSS